MKDEHYSIWSEYLDRVPLNPDQRKVLRNAINADSKLVTELHDDQIINGLLKLLAESQQYSDTFCEQCVSKFEKAIEKRNEPESLKEQSNAKNIGLPAPLESKSDEPSTGFEIVTASSTSSDKALTANQLLYRKQKSTQWLAAMLALATLIVIGMFVAVMRYNDSNVAIEEPSPTASDGVEQHLSDTLPEMQTPDLVSKPDAVENPLPVQESPDLPQLNDDPFPKQMTDREPLVFAQVFDEENAEWETPIAKQIGAGTYRLLKGNSVIQMDNLLGLFLFGPATIELDSKGKIRLVSGRVFIDAANSDVESLVIETRDANLKDLNRARFFSEVNVDGTSISLNQGSVGIAMNSDDRQVLLDNDGLKHAFINNSTSESDTATEVMIAQGTGDKYFAQIGVGEDAARSTTRNEFDKLLEGKWESDRDTNASDQLRSKINEFNNRLRQFQQQFRFGNPNNSGNNLLDQMLPNMNNGQPSIPFGSSGDFEKFREELQRRFGGEGKSN